MPRIHRVCILGGGGFVGRTLCRQLVAAGREVTVLSRRPERRGQLRTLSGVKLVKADVHQPEVLEKYFVGMDAVINLVGILNEFRYQQFRDVHVNLPGNVMRACWKVGVPRLLHMSALHADVSTGLSEYLRTKGEAEQMLHVNSGGCLHVTRFRPSVIFGPQDQFFNRFANLLKYSPWVFPLAAAWSKLSPVYVGDVAQAFVRTLEEAGSYGQRYDLWGPHEYTLGELVRYTAKLCGYKRKIVSLGNRASMLQAFLTGMLPGKPFTLDNYHSLQTEGSCRDDGLNLLGIEKTSVEAVVPSYLGGEHTQARYDAYRKYASREESRFL